jgi:DUF917 family protein
MRELGAQDLTDLVEGAAVYSSGGGGDPVVGLNIVEKLLEKRFRVRLIEPAEVPKNAMLVSFACVGATANIAYHGDAAAKTLSILEEFLEAKVFALIPAELGGFSTLAAVDAAARHGIPLMDADGAGRAVPEMHLQTYMIDNMVSTPALLADIDAKKMLLMKQKDDPQALEQIARVLTERWSPIIYSAQAILTDGQVRTSPVLHTVSKSIRLGMVLRKAVDPVKAVLKETNGYRLFEGTVADVKSETKNGFTWTTLKMDGIQGDSESRFEMKARNELLVAYRDGHLVAVAPDVITTLSYDTCKYASAEKLLEGNRLAVIGIPAPDQWRKPQGLKLWEEVLRRSDIDETYVPIEKLAE